jgi:hypothetical protein
MNFSIKQRRFKRGFLGLSSAEPAQSLIRELRNQEQKRWPPTLSARSPRRETQSLP